MTERKIPVVLTGDEQRDLLDQFNTRYVTTHRNKVMYRLMLNTGLRVSEVTALRWNNIDFDSNKLMVREGKGAKDRTLWISEDISEDLREWRDRQAEELGERSKYVFTTMREGKSGNRLSIQQVWETLKTYVRKAGIEKNVSPHTLRHTFATDLYRETKDIRLVQKALGHSDLSTTMIYTHIVDDELEEALKNFRG